MTKNSSLILTSFIFGVFSTLFIWFLDEDIAYALSREDGVVESLTAMFYVIAIVIGIFSIFKAERIILPVLWTVLSFIFLGEETSWFQRIFDYSVPGVEQISSQSEFNIHNLFIFQADSLLDSSFSLSTLLKSQNLFRIGFFGYFLILPFLFYIPMVRRLMPKIGYQRPSNSFMFVLVSVFGLSLILAMFANCYEKVALAETREMLYAFFIMLYVFIYVKPGAMSETQNVICDS